MTYVRGETISVSEPLTDAERLKYGQEMADALAKIEEYEAALDAERKHSKRLIEQQEKIAQTASKHYRDGKEEREVRRYMVQFEAKLTLHKIGYVRPKQVVYIMGVSRATLYNWIEAGKLPKPERLGAVWSHGLSRSSGER